MGLGARLAALASLLLVLVLSSAAYAELPRVLVVAPAAHPPPAGLADALRIQLAGRAEVKDSIALEGDSLVSNTESATKLVRDNAARLVVWAEAATEPGVYLLHIVGDREGRALVVVFRLASEDGVALERALALKVAEVFDAVELEVAERAMAVQVVAPPPTKPAPPPAEEHDTRLSFVADLGGWGATGAGTAGWQGGVGFGVGLRLRHGALLGDFTARGRVASSLHAENEHGMVDADEAGFGGAVGLAAVVDFVAIGGLVAFGGRVIQAVGETPRGKVGEGTSILPDLFVGPQAIFLIAPFVGIGVHAGVDVTLRHHRFLVNEMPVLDPGTVRGMFGANVVFSVP